MNSVNCERLTKGGRNQPCHSRSDERGFTIHELLVVMVVSSILVSLGLSLFLSVGKLFTSWDRKSELRTRANAILQQVALDVQRSKAIQSFTDTSLVLTQTIERDILYRFDGKSVWRNGVRLGAGDDIETLLHLKDTLNTSANAIQNLKLLTLARARGAVYEAHTLVTIAHSSVLDFTAPMQTTGHQWTTQ